MLRWLLSCLVFVSYMIFHVLIVYGAVFYVDPVNGNDANPGSQAQPWKTLWTGVATRALVGGNTINIVGGTYTRDQLIGTTSDTRWRSTESHGTLGNPLIIQAAPGQTVIVDGQQNPRGFMRFELLDGPSHDYHIVLRNLTMTNFKYLVLGFGGFDPDTHARYFLLENCIIENDHFFNTTGAVNSGFVDHIIFRNNTFRNIGTLSIPSPLPAGFNPQHAFYPGEGTSYLLIENNTMTTIANGGIELWGETTTPETVQQHIVRRNIIHNAGGAGLRYGAQATVDTYVYHNTVFSTTTPVPTIPSWGLTNGGMEPRTTSMTNYTMLNNIVYGPWEFGALRFHNTGVNPVPLRTDANILVNLNNANQVVRYNGILMSWASYRSVTASEGTPQEVNGLSQDPKFTNATAGDFTLQQTSPAINRGLFLTTTTNSGTNSTTLVVSDSRFFHDGWNLIAGDTIQIQDSTPATAVQVTNINYGTHTLTLAAARTWQSGKGVSQPWQGSKPDMGALEASVPGSAPTATITSPTTSTTYTSPIATVAISGTAADTDGNLASVTFTCVVQGTGSCLPSSGNANGTPAVWSLPTLTLTSGTTALVTVLAADATGLQGQDTLTISYTAAPPPLATYYVRPDGSDTTGDGSQGSPWRTVQKALNTMVAGDRVILLPGTFYEQVTFPTPGTSGARITVQGTRDGSGALLSIIDGSQATSGWVTAPEIGAGVWKTTTGTLGFTPAAATVDGKALWMLGAHTWGHPSYDAATALTRGATEQVSSAVGPVGWWDGLEGLFGLQGSTVYVRLRNGESPATRTVRMAPSGGTVTMTGAGAAYVTMQDVQVQGGESQVHVGTSAQQIVLDGLVLRDGTHRLLVNGNAAQVTLTNSLLTLDDLGAQTYLPGNWHDLNYTGVVNRHRYDVNKFWIGNTETADASILIDDSTGVIVDNSLLETGVAGITFYGTSSGHRITGTTIRNHSDNCVYAHMDSTTVTFDHNLLVNCDHLIRFEALHRAQTWYIYANRFWQDYWATAQYLGGGKHIFFAAPITGTSPAILRIYQNSFAGGGWALDFGSGTFGPTLDWNVQNNLRTTYGWSSAPTGPWTFGTQYVDTNLWQSVTMPDFRLPAGHAALDTATALPEASWPGMSASYYVDGLPDYGALQGTATTPVATALVWQQQPSAVYTNTAMAPPVAVEVRDQNNALFTASPVTVTVGLTVPAGTVLSGTLTRQTVVGTATFDDLMLDNTSGSPHTLTASASGLPSIQSTPFTVTQLPPVATTLALTQQPTTGLVNAALTPALVAQVLDQNGTLFTASSVTVTATKTTGSGTLGGTVSRASVNGVVTFDDLTLNAADTYTLTLSFTTGTTDDVTTSSIVVSAAPPVATALAFASLPVTVSVNTAFTGTVQVLDQYGAALDPDPEVAVTITKTAGAGTLTGGGPVTTSAGLATFPTLSLSAQPTTVTLEAAGGGLTVATAQVDVGPQPLVADHLFFSVQPANTYAGYLLAPVTVWLLSAQNALVTDDNSRQITLTLTDNTEGATLSGTTTVTVTGGIATFSTLAVDLPGTYTLTATAGVLTGAVSSSFRVDVAPLSNAELHWQLNDGAPATTATDSGLVPNRYPGSITAATWATPGHKQANYLAFQAANSATVSNASYSIPSNSPFTAVFWLRIPVGTTTTQGLWQVGPGDPGDGIVAGARVLNGTSLEWYYGANAGGGPISTPFAAVLLDTWVRVVLTATGTAGLEKAIYLNGQLQRSVASAVAPTHSLSSLTLGRHQPYSTQNHCTCDVEDFRLYHRTWTLAEVSADFAAAEPPPAGITAHPSGMLLIR